MDLFWNIQPTDTTTFNHRLTTEAKAYRNRIVFTLYSALLNGWRDGNVMLALAAFVRRSRVVRRRCFGLLCILYVGCSAQRLPMKTIFNFPERCAHCKMARRHCIYISDLLHMHDTTHTCTHISVYAFTDRSPQWWPTHCWPNNITVFAQQKTVFLLFFLSKIIFKDSLFAITVTALL